MFSYTTTFPVMPYQTADKLLQKVSAWLKQAKNMKLTLKLEDMQADDDHGTYRQIVLPDGFAGRYESKDKMVTEVLTEIVFDQKQKQLTLHVLTNEPEMEKHVPSIVTAMIGLADLDNGFAIKAEPTIVENAQVQMIANVVPKNKYPSLPIVVIPPNGDGFMSIDFGRMAKGLAGRAHVFVIGDLQTASTLSSMSNNVVPSCDCLTILGQGKTITVDFEEYPIDDDLDREVDRLVTAYTSYDTRTLTSWNDMLEKKLEAAMAQTKTMKVSESRENTLMNKRYEELSHEFETKMAKAEEKLGKKQEEITSLRRELAVAQTENAYLTNRVNNQDKSALLYYGGEKDYYDSEVRETILGCLEEQKKAVTGRARDILGDVLEANPANGSKAKYKREIRNALLQTDGELGRLTRTLKQYGFTVEELGSNHIGGTWHDDPRYKVTFSATPISSNYSTQNMIAQVCNIIFG